MPNLAGLDLLLINELIICVYMVIIRSTDAALMIMMMMMMMGLPQITLKHATGQVHFSSFPIHHDCLNFKYVSFKKEPRSGWKDGQLVFLILSWVMTTVRCSCCQLGNAKARKVKVRAQPKLRS